MVLDMGLTIYVLDMFKLHKKLPCVSCRKNEDRRKYFLVLCKLVKL